MSEVVVGAISGIIIATLINAFVPILGDYGNDLRVLLNLLNFLAVIGFIDQATKLSITYLFGYLIGITLVGSLLLEQWEVELYFIGCIIGIIAKLKL